eukprot:TRINITY_DN6261_c0_g1_i5.p2 TRINITY_DN6261_c0_g1~~TRINITY_DN6261_c0_g1_i5.p2  ORF type:complete len:154 (-),score=54.07 TRINITY_DN6261_c0_g1_i5:82-543(-)
MCIRDRSTLVEKIELKHNDRVIFGTNAVFVFQEPHKISKRRSSIIDDVLEIDWEMAQTELLTHNDKFKKNDEIDIEQQEQLNTKLKEIEEQFKNDLSKQEEMLKQQQEDYEKKIQELEERMQKETEQKEIEMQKKEAQRYFCLLYTSPSPRDS